MKKNSTRRMTITACSSDPLYRFALALVASITLLGAAPSAARAEASGAEGARGMVENMVDKILVELGKEGIDDNVKIKSLEVIVFNDFDFKTISRLVLARNFKKFSAEQATEFTERFKVYLSRSYGSRLIRYANEKVEFRDERLEKRGDVTVMTVIVGGAADGFEMNYRVRGGEGKWKVIDVQIEGISLISNFRSQFKDIVNRDGPENLLARLRDKTFVLPDPETDSAKN